MKLQHRVAFITGAAQGIGLAIAERFVGEGAHVVLADIDGVRADAEARKIGADRAHGLALDVSDSAAVAAAVAETVSTFGRLDIAVAGAAVMTPARPIADLAEADWQAAIDVNLSGAFLVSKHCIQQMRGNGGGNVILIASQMAQVAWPGGAAYSTTKGGLLQLAKGIALDHANDGIRANTLSPGGTATRRLEAKFGDMATAQREWGAKHPLGRLADVTEIASGAVFLASDDSSFMTGTDLLIDGGYSAW
jgi:NAD(P)-dependent dehydrogenase (short-subunit alcohol dehydrogenase family)